VWSLSEKYEKSAKWTLFDLQAMLQQSGWMVPAYTLPKDIDDIVVMRIVIRQGMSRDMADMLLKDIANAVAELDKLKHPTPSKEEQRRKGRVFTH
jgi:glutamate decarboxylase